MAALVEVLLLADYFGSENFNPALRLRAVTIQQAQVSFLHLEYGALTNNGEGVSAVVMAPIMPARNGAVHFLISSPPGLAGPAALAKRSHSTTSER